MVRGWEVVRPPPQKGFVGALGRVGVSPWGHGAASGRSSWGCRVPEIQIYTYCVVCVYRQSFLEPLRVSSHHGPIGSLSFGWKGRGWCWGSRSPHSTGDLQTGSGILMPAHTGFHLDVIPLAPSAGPRSCRVYQEWCGGGTGSYWEASRGLGSASAVGGAMGILGRF